MTVGFIEAFIEAKVNGLLYIQSLIENKITENIHMEFKEKADRNISLPAKDDKRNLGKSISAFANADGGLIIFGIRTSKDSEGTDYCSDLRPISEILSFEANVRNLIDEIIQPIQIGIETYSVVENNKSGYLFILVPKSNSRPVMSQAPDHLRYFRRTIFGTKPLDHYEVRDLFLSNSQPELDIRCSIRATSRSFKNDVGAFGIGIQVILRNIGTITARSPYIFFDKSLKSGITAYVGQKRNRPNLGLAVYTPPNHILHADDEEALCEIEFFANVNYRLMINNNLDFIDDGVIQLGWARVDVDKLNNHFKTIILQNYIGAENSEKKHVEIFFNRDEIINSILLNSRNLLDEPLNNGWL